MSHKVNSHKQINKRTRDCSDVVGHFYQCPCWCFLGDKAAVRQVEHRAEGLSPGSTSAQPAPRLHESFAEGSHCADGNGEAGRMGRFPGPCAVSL